MAVNKHLESLGIKAILFDLGGVLIQLGGITQMMRWTGMDHDKLWRQWLASPSVRSFESGRMTVEEFGIALVEEFNLPIPADEFLTLFAAWPQGVYPGTEALLEKAGALYPLGCLSNTNSLHWEYLTKSTRVVGYFNYLFPSHLTGLLKPDHKSFSQAIEIMGFQPEHVLFFDDNQVNIEGAREVGLRGYMVKDAHQASTILEKLGLLKSLNPQQF